MENKEPNLAAVIPDLGSAPGALWRSQKHSGSDPQCCWRLGTHKMYPNPATGPKGRRLATPRGQLNGTLEGQAPL